MLTALRTLLTACFLLFAFAPPHVIAAFSSGGKNPFLASSEEAVLEPDAAFKLQVFAVQDNALKAIFTIAPGHYLYRERIHFSVQDAPSIHLDAELPHGELKHDPNFGEMEVFHQDFEATLTLTDTKPLPAEITLLANYQGCSEKGLCYAPIKKTFTLPLGSDANQPAEASRQASNDPITDLLKSGKFWLIATGFFGFGLLLSLSPCVLPMIPILSGIIVGDKRSHHAHSSKLHTFNLSLAYTLGMAVTYTLAGIAAGLSGKLLSNALQTPWALGFMAIIFVLLALSMFGFYELRLPDGFENRVLNLASRFRGGHLLGVFVMGIFSALIVSPCIVAPLAGVLLYISQTHDVLLGGIALFTLSLGMGVPLLLIGASAGRLLPKAGIWMNHVRQVFGVLMLGVAIWLIKPVIPVALQLLLWAALLIIPAIYMHATDRLPSDASPWAKFWKGIAIIMLLLGISLVIGAASGAKSPLAPLANLQAGMSAKVSAPLPFEPVRNSAELDSTLAASDGRFVMLDFYADWCVACKEFEQYTFADPRVVNQLRQFRLLKADVTDNTADDAALLKRFGLFGPPGIIFFDKKGKQVTKVIGYQDAETFIQTLRKLQTP
jgi:thiol:disulfide interchange protein DsbD